MSLKDKFKQKLLALNLPNHTKLLIVSKMRSIEEITAYYELGHRDFGENRVQELQEKALALKDICPEIRWHMIGHIQSNKINNLFKVPNLYAIHSVDDLELVRAMIKAEKKLHSELSLFLQVNTSHEEQKAGFENESELLAAAKLINGPKNLKLLGLMTMGTLRTDKFESEARRCFLELNQIKGRLESSLGKKLESSMGMSQDYKIAIEAGSNWIRLGTVMFQD